MYRGGCVVFYLDTAECVGRGQNFAKGGGMIAVLLAVLTVFSAGYSNVAKGGGMSIAKLVRDIGIHRAAYARGAPLISDVEYDALEDQLRQLDPNHQLLQQPWREEGAGEKVAHDVPMLSLQKTYSMADLLSWVGEREVVGALKIDGNSLSLVYRAGQLQVAKTRGDGQRGENVTAKCEYIETIPASLSDTRHLEIRGELHCSQGKFFVLAAEMEGLGLPKPTSPRNVVAGLLGRKEHPDLVRHFSFVAFDLLYHDEGVLPATEMDKLGRLTKLGFALPEPQLLTSAATIEAYLEQVRIKMADYDNLHDSGDEDKISLDGAVISFNDLAYARELGSTAHHPRSRMAFKWQGATAVTKINNIVWDTSRFGIVTPVAEIEPVSLHNALLRRVTLHNAATVKLYNLKRGTEIKIVRSGEVIPKFLEVVREAEGELDLPAACPSCAAPLEDDGVRLLCTSNACPAQQLRSVLNWLRAAEVRDLSEKRLAAMMELGLVQTIPDLYRLTKDDLLRVPLTGERMANKLHAAIAASKQLPAERLLSGLGIRGGGRATWRALLQVAPTLEGLLRLTAEDIGKIDGFAAKSAEQIYQGLQDRRALIDELLAVGVEVIAPTVPQTGSQQGQKYVISGALSQPRAFYQELLEKHGATLASSVSAKTTAVVTADASADSSKIKAARKLKIPLIDEQELLTRLQQGNS